MPPASRSADAPHSPPLGPPDDALRSVTLSGDPAYFALPPLARGTVSRPVTVRGYVSGASDPLPGPGVPRAFRAIDVEGWAAAALGLVEAGLAAAAVAAERGEDGDAAPLARLVAAKSALAAAIAAGAREVVPGKGNRTAAVAAFERALDVSLTRGWAATGIAQLPMAVDAQFGDGGSHRLAVASRPLPGRDGQPSRAAVSPGVLGLDAANDTLDLVVDVEDPRRHAHLRLDVELAAAGIEHVADPKPPAPGAPPTAPALGPWQASLDLPVPVRALPEPPQVVAVEALEPGDDDTLEPNHAGTWRFRATFAVASTDQDQLWLRTDWNQTPDAVVAGPADRSATPAPGPVDPFAALAELVDNDLAIRADLVRLVPGPGQPEPDTESRALALEALTAVAELSEQLAASWGPIDPGDTAPDPGLRVVPGSTVTLRLETIVDAGVDGPGTVEGFVLRRAAGTPWGPEERRPQLGYDADDGDGLVVLDPVTVDGDPDALRYAADPDRPVPRDERRTIALCYPGLGAVRTRNACTGAWVVRNAALVAGRETVPAFVSRTAETSPAAPVAPCRVVGEPIVIGRGTMADFGAVLANALAVVTVPGRTRQSLAVQYGYRLAPEQEEGNAGPDVLVPILLVPSFDDVAVPVQVAEQVAAWCAQHAPATGTDRHLSLELRVFDGAVPAGAPLLTLSRLEYDLTS